MLGWQLILVLPMAAGFILIPRGYLTTRVCVSAEEMISLDFRSLLHAMTSMGISDSRAMALRDRLITCGFESTAEVLTIARGLSDRPESLSSLLASDLKLSVIDSHILRAALLHILHEEDKEDSSVPLETVPSISIHPSTPTSTIVLPFALNRTLASRKYKETRLINRASRDNDTYGLRETDLSPFLRRTLSEFESFMRDISPMSQEPPIRKPTADVYMRQIKLFLGWYIRHHGQPESLLEIFPSKERQGVTSVFSFIKWLHSSRRVSSAYEASMIRGLIKFAKFRYSNESQSGDLSRSYDDIPAIKELRKLHRDTNKGQKNSARVSNEELKWISWPEYLNVIETLGKDLRLLLEELREKKAPECRRRAIASTYQKYLVLSMLAAVPDRQRTFRELSLGTTFVKHGDAWVIKHGPLDYKTGSSYGDRPPLPIPQSLTTAIDDWIENFRPTFKPVGDHLFVQPRTGNQLTGDGMYKIVSKTVFQYTGKKTNPHLLRDMVVTHARDGSATEKELEALALYMGHSIAMQRNSYDRRTLKQKVAPAIDLLHSISKSGMK